MRKETLENGIRFLYKFKEGNYTSFSIAIDAGANRERKNNIGVSHALEHSIFKGTKNMCEEEINNKIDELFGINNAMTNFPYVIYYGTTINEDFKEGLALYGDMLLNPILNDNGFHEEINVIKQESNEWKEDLDQYCEDLLYANGFPNERISETIIGNIECIEKITLKEMYNFYKRFYNANNMVISVVSSLQYEYIKKLINRIFGELHNDKNNYEEKQRIINRGLYVEKVKGNNGCKIAVAFDLSNLSLSDMSIMKLFNLWFGEGVSSILYDEIRTKFGLAYDVYSEVKWEKGIKLFKIGVSTSKENIEKVKFLIEKCINKAKNLDNYMTYDDLSKLKKRLKLKNSLELERSIVLANRSAIYELLYNKGEYVLKESVMEYRYSIEDIKNMVNRILKDPIIQVLT